MAVARGRAPYGSVWQQAVGEAEGLEALERRVMINAAMIIPDMNAICFLVAEPLGAIEILVQCASARLESCPGSSPQTDPLYSIERWPAQSLQVAPDQEARVGG